MTIILNDDSLNKIFFPPKNKMPYICFFFKLIIFNCSSQCPDMITNLVNLQVLKLNGCLSLKELPRGIDKLINLRRLGYLLHLT